MRAGFLRALTAAACLSVVGLALTYQNPKGAVAVTHLVSMMFGLIILKSSVSKAPKDALTLLSATMMIVLGPLGAIAAVVLLVTHWWVGPRDSELAWLLEPEVDHGEGFSRRVHGRLARMKAHSPEGKFVSEAPIVPFLDTIRFGTDKEKQMALGQIGRNYSPSYAPALEAGLQDSAGLIRVQVGSTLSAIEEQSRQVSTKKESIPERTQRVIAELSRGESKLANPPVSPGKLTSRNRNPERNNRTARPTLLECRILIEDLIREKKFSEARELLRTLMREESRRSEATQNLICRFLFARKSFAALRRYLAWVKRPVSLAAVVHSSIRRAAND